MTQSEEYLKLIKPIHNRENMNKGTKYAPYPVTGPLAQAFLDQNPMCKDTWELSEMPHLEAQAERAYQHATVQATYGQSTHISRADAYARISAGESFNEIVKSLKITE